MGTRPHSMRRVLVFVILAMTSGYAPAQQPRIYDDRLPPSLVKLLEQLKSTTNVSPVLDALSRDGHHLPYLRMEHAVTLDARYRRYLAEVMTTLDENIAARNQSRCRSWISDNRLDLFNEFMGSCGNREAIEMADLTMPMRKKAWRELLMLSNPKNAYAEAQWGPLFGKIADFPHLTDESLVVPVTVREFALVRAPKCRIDTFGKFSWLVCAGTLDDPLKPAGGLGEWLDSIVFVNSSATIESTDRTLYICSDDIRVVQPNITRSMLLAGGDILIESDPRSVGKIAHSYLAASGDIRFKGPAGGPEQSLLHACGRISSTDKLPSEFALKEKRSSLPFGIKFVDPKEFGLELALQNGGVQVMGIAKESPFAKFGVEDADVITRIDDVVPKSLADFRRALRRGVIRESVILHIKRSGKDLTRIVFLDGIPVPLAPPPRPK